ncbi:TetR/AcrR family transcriptional regulator [Gordonia alkanivorans]|uniref:TetR/AcrR family transcriptional regulator n=1 Tax=Gordonia alkanivorans TaxID=84096 RepID=UPI001F4D7BE4|nr:TetR/AcrR family transcriptional regulator [Gordonia alkanivorans]MDH3006758.1 TetR/AcrR family transcriptional regulator [Gordonia alkanivorans]MDH3026878.1 TetR/AcrR family transcriptional regulator [Gordonia alkanivorans]MDH3061377.1 TetR/AcrR family transcriptional regulator [Gordonia alkanivorans]
MSFCGVGIVSGRQQLCPVAVATAYSSARRTDRRQSTIDEALGHARNIIDEQGVGAVSISEIARRMQMRPPSLYKYFPSLNALYDRLFEMGNVELSRYVDDARLSREPGLDQLLEQSRAIIRWSMTEPGLAALLFWRPVPGFEPSEAAFAPARAIVDQAREDLATAVARGELSPGVDSEDALRLLTSVVSGIGSQQMSNEPGATYETGSYTGLLDDALQMWVRHYSP